MNGKKAFRIVIAGAADVAVVVDVDDDDVIRLNGICTR